MEPVDGAPTITNIHLDTTITAEGADSAKVVECAEKAKAGCPISKVLAATEITMEAKHVG